MIDSLGWQTIRIKWLPQNQDFNVMITGVVPAKSQPDLNTGSASSATSTAGDVGVDTTNSTAAGGRKVKKKRKETTHRVLGLDLPGTF